MPLISRICAMAMSVILLVTAQGSAFALGQAPAEDRVVLCTGHGAQIVYLDQDGQPTSAPQLCAECLQALFVDLTADRAPLERAAQFFDVTAPERSQLRQNAEIKHERARSPPQL